jgi:transcriptional regulator with XRE-family HTH domain
MSQQMQPRHNVARLRRALGLSQEEFARQMHRATVTVKAVENLRLRLSPMFAFEIASTFGIDDKWLLANDLQTPVPAPNSPFANLSYEEARPVELLLYLFAKLFERARALSPEIRSYLAMEIGWEVEDLKGTKNGPISEKPVVLDASLIQYLKTHRSDPALQWVNFDALLSLQPLRRRKEPKRRIEQPKSRDRNSESA